MGPGSPLRVVRDDNIYHGGNTTMSELVPAHPRTTIRWQLLTTTSALILAAYVSSTAAAKAEDADRPTVWIELGGQFNTLNDGQKAYSPPFLRLEPSQFDSPLNSMRPPRHSFDLSGEISIRPQESDWVFSASIRYGRSKSQNHLHQQSYPQIYSKYVSTFGNRSHRPVQPFAAQFVDAKSRNVETHAIMDFQAGRDLGIGLFGGNGSSTLSLGVRYAQFTAKSSTSLHENPDWAFHTKILNYYSGLIVIQAVNQQYHSYAGRFEADRSFRGIGPSLSWKNSTPFAGNPHDGAFALDWGVNASLLFGRQKAHTAHYETAQYHPPGAGPVGDTTQGGNRITLYQGPATPEHTRSRNVVVPNIGAFAGVSFKYPNAKVSVGYRADFFFGAMDSGIDAGKTYDRNFYGPFAAISIGLGG
jgi:hypothetical protein